MAGLFYSRQTFTDLNVSTPRIGQNAYREIHRSRFAIRSIELDSRRFQVPANLLDILHFKSDAVEGPPFGSGNRSSSLREQNIGARNLAHRLVAMLYKLGAKPLLIPGLSRGGIRDNHLDLIRGDRR